MNNLLRHLAGVVVLALSPMVVLTVGTQAVSSAQPIPCSPNMQLNLETGECEAPPAGTCATRGFIWDEVYGGCVHISVWDCEQEGGIWHAEDRTCRDY